MTGTSNPGAICSDVNPEHLSGALREFCVGLVEDGVLVVFGGHAKRFHQGAPGSGDVLEVGRFTGEAHAVLG